MLSATADTELTPNDATLDADGTLSDELPPLLLLLLLDPTAATASTELSLADDAAAADAAAAGPSHSSGAH